MSKPVLKSKQNLSSKNISKEENKIKITNENNEQVKLLSPKLDIIFQALFGEIGSERITRRFLKSIIKEEIKDINLNQNTILRREYEDDKLGILDIVAKINGNENCNIEMQLVDTGELEERMLYYWSKLYAKEIKKGEKFDKLQKTIVILLADFELDKLRNLDYHTEWKIIDTKTKKTILTDKLELHIIEIPKVKEKEERDKLFNLVYTMEKSKKEKETVKMENNQEEHDELLDWILFLQDPSSEYIVEKATENEELKEAVEKLKKISQDENLIRMAEVRERKLLDEGALRRTGIKEGERNAKLEIAKKMLERKIPIEMIIEITGISKEEILN